ncbi:MAG: TetR/AcrR family transcriptional regulator, partial [Saprospiraceae bacterium]|nr:TetR/AcrR family transcriptional regulator [Saprospiraceae bacterium]
MSTSTKRDQKEKEILIAAEQIFAQRGFANAKMDDIASAANISKGTVYFYFDTKENLYMALTYQAIQSLNDLFYRVIDENRSESGLTGLLALVECYLSYCDAHPLYADMMLEYMSINRTTRNGRDSAKLTLALQESIYYRKIQDIQNIPINLITQEIRRGVEDGSVLNRRSPELLYLLAWGSTVGYLKLNTAAGRGQSLLNVKVGEWREHL